MAAALLALAVCVGSARAQENPEVGSGLRAGNDEAALPAPSDLNDAGDETTPSKKPKPKAPLIRKPSPGALPPLRFYKGAQRMDTRGGPVSPVAGNAADAPLTPGPTIAALPEPPARRRIPVEANPYDPLGVRIGDLKLTPYVEEDAGYSTNPASVAGASKGSGFETTEVGLGLQSDWSRDDLHGQLKGGYTDYFDSPQTSAPYGSGTLDGRYEVSRDLAFDAEGRFNIVREPLSSIGVTAADGDANADTTLSTFGGTVGAAQKFGDLTLGLHGSLDRTSYQDSSLASGTTGNLTADDFDDWGLRARASYRLSEAASPFFELGVDARRYDSGADALGYARDSDGLSGKAGLTLNYSQLLTGEASVGYGGRNYQDPRLPNVRAPLIDASLIWSATPLTTIALKTQTQLADSVLAGASADINRSYTIDISHALTRQLKLGLLAGYATDHYVGAGLTDSTTTVGATAEYHFSREVVLKASATRTQFDSSAPNSNYVANVFMLGLRFQR